MSNTNSSKPEWKVRGADGAYRGLCISSAIYLSAVSLIMICYSLTLQRMIATTVFTLGLVFALAAITAVLVSHGNRLRRLLGEASVWTPPQWGRRENNQDLENPYIVEFEQGRSIHFWLLGMIPVVIVVCLAVYMFLRMGRLTDLDYVLDPKAMLLGILGFVLSCMCLIFARSCSSVSADDLPEAGGLTSALCETQIISLGLALILVLRSFIGLDELWVVELWTTRVLLGWTMVVGIELFFKLLLGWVNRSKNPQQFTSPVDLMSRKLIFVLGDPMNGLFNTLETKYGISFRSSWAIRFVGKALVPVIVLVIVLSWGLTSLSVVRLGEMGIMYQFGQVKGEPLTPGLYMKMPWPLGKVKTYPVKQVTMIPLGFKHDEAAESVGSKHHAYLWTEKHGEEFELFLGNAREAVAVNGMIYYKIREDKEGFHDYVFSCQNPGEAVEIYGYRVLMEMTRTRTAEEVLTMDRERFAREIQQRVAQLCQADKLGIEIVEVALLNLHPPVEAAPDYLDVVSQKIKKEIAIIQAESEAHVSKLQATQDSSRMIAEAKVNAAKLEAGAQEKSAEFIAVGEAFKVAPDAFMHSYWLNTIEQTLANKKIVLIDQDLPLYWDMNKNRNSTSSAARQAIRAE